MLAHNGFVVCVICVPYNLIVSLMHLSLSFIVFWFLLYLVQSSLATWPACQAACTILVCGQLSSPFPRSSLMSFRRSISFCHFWLLSFGCCRWVAPCWVYCGVAFFCAASLCQVCCDPPGSRRSFGCDVYIVSRAFYAVDLVGNGCFFIE